MKRKEIFKTLSQYKKILEDKGYNVIYIGLYGSQNYNVDDELSDIDCKAIVLPSLHDIIFRKVTSTTIELDTGAIDVKDLITFYDVIRKGDFSYIESIDTEYSIGDKYIKSLFKQNYTKKYVEKESDKYIEFAKQLIPNDYKYEPIDLSKEVSEYIENKLKLELIKNNEVASAREVRTFDNSIPKNDLERFPILEQYKGQDISYIVYESIDIL